jgi:dihydropteroate synthase
VVEGLSARLKVAISIDTMKPAVARAALEAGARIVNDVAANRSDEAMWRVVAEASAGYVCMHMQGTPQTMQAHPDYRDVVEEVREFFFDRIRRLNHCGVSGEQIILDPGIGFGKMRDHNLQLLANLRSFQECGRPMLVGMSRKSFMGNVLEERLPAALAGASHAVEAGALIIRTHDVAETNRAIRMTEAILAMRKP